MYCSLAVLRFERDGRSRTFDDATAKRLEEGFYSRPFKIAVYRLGPDQRKGLAMLVVHEMLVVYHFYDSR